MAFAHRLASREDLPQIVAIYNSTIPSRQVTADIEPVSVQSRLHWFEEHSAEFRPLWVVEAEGRIAGWLSFSSFYGRAAYNRTAELSVYVHADLRKRGIASFLLTQAFAQSPGLGIDTLLGFIFGHNSASLALFEKFGFRRWGELPKVALLDGMERDLVIVGRRATSSATLA
ncbi:MAG: GNAT family N-acetyltransferase [Betaproteobacteria bacterium]